VAGYDVSRLMAGALGTLGALLEVSFKILPRPEIESTQVFECTTSEALTKMHDWGLKPLPVSATCFYESKLYVRLSGTEKAVLAAGNQMGGETYSEANAFWDNVKEQRLSMFSSTKSLWRLSLASDIAPLNIEGNCLYEWGGALRWLSTNESCEAVRSLVENAGGQATLFRGNDQTGEIFSPLPVGLKTIHKNLKQAFDPKNILNPGKMYSDI